MNNEEIEGMKSGKVWLYGMVFAVLMALARSSNVMCMEEKNGWQSNEPEEPYERMLEDMYKMVELLREYLREDFQNLKEALCWLACPHNKGDEGESQ